MMEDKISLNYANFEKRISKLEHALPKLRPSMDSALEAMRAVQRLIEASQKTTDGEFNILLRAIVRLRGLTPKHLNTKHLIMALLTDECGVKLPFPKKASVKSVPPQ
jgi:hypothetical protein